MTAITQKIRRFTGGISDQPDEQKLPGQVRDAVNCVPDVVQGLVKRPGLNLVRELDTDQTGKWFFIDKSNNFNNKDRYVAQINTTTGKVRVWDLDNGKLMDVCYTDNVDPLDINPTSNGIVYNIPDYVTAYHCEGEEGQDPSEDYFVKENPEPDDLQTLTINDYTFVTNRKVPVAMNLNTAERRNPEATVEIKSIAGLQEYTLDFFQPGQQTANTAVIAATITATGTENDPPACTSTFDQTFTGQSAANGTDLAFRIVTTSAVDGDGDCAYTHTLTILNGGEGWAVGNTVTVSNGDVDYTITVTEIGARTITNAVTELSVTNSAYNNNPPTCGSQDEETFTGVTGAGASAGTGLDIDLVTSAITAAVDDGNGGVTNSCVYTTRVTITAGGTGWQVGDTFTRTMAGVTYNFQVEKIGVSVERTQIGQPVRATTARENPQADDLLDALITGIENLEAGFEVERIGNSLYITREEPFSVTTPNSILLRVLSSTEIDTDSYLVQANDIAEIPLQTKHDLIFKIRNSFNDSDDYYVQFKGDNNTDGTGTYVEVARPGLEHQFNPASMPHGIIRLRQFRTDTDGDLIVTFLVAGFKWASRQAGDDITNPRPSFAPEAGELFGRPINNLSFYRNRLIALSDENVVCSVAGDFFNFWGKTALTVSPSDPIDLQVSNNFPSVLFNSVATTSGLVMFSENAQFMLSTENDVLEPRTARTTLLSAYNYNRNSNPINLGTTVGFVSGIGRYTRFYEMANISRDREPEVVEQTKVVERKVPGEYYDITITKDNQIVSMGKRGFDTVWIFRYFNTGEKRAQSSWTRWQFDGELVAHSLINDSYFVVLRKDDRTWLVRGDIRALQNTQMLVDNDGEEYRTFLDYVISVEKSTDDNPGYTENTRTRVKLDDDGNQEIVTTVESITINIADVNFPYFSDSKDKIMSVVYDPENEQGYIQKCEINEDETEITIDTQISNCKIFLGYVFNFNVVLPHIFIKKESSGSSESWDSANVIIQRVKLNLGRVGYYETTLKRLGRDDYTQIYEAKPMDEYEASEIGYVADYEQTTPVYQRNTTFLMSIHSAHPSPAVLYSATWEGQYQENYVKRL